MKRKHKSSILNLEDQVYTEGASKQKGAFLNTVADSGEDMEE